MSRWLIHLATIIVFCIPGLAFANPEEADSSDALFDTPKPREDKPSPSAGKGTVKPPPRIKSNKEGQNVIGKKHLGINRSKMRTICRKADGLKSDSTRFRRHATL